MLKRLSHIRRFPIVAMLVLGLLLAPTSALACGGLFSSQGRVSQDTERLLITIGKQTTTLVEEIHYAGKASDFAWVLPVPVAPKVDVVSNKYLFTRLENLTAPRFITPEPKTCDYADITRLLENGKTSGSAPNTQGVTVNTYGGGTAGPFAYEVIGSSDPHALTEWLQAHHYAVPNNTQDLIRPYVQKKMLFLAMRLQVGQDVSNIQPVQITFPTVMKQVMVPIGLAATDINERMNMEVSIVSTERFAPQNYKDISIDTNRISQSPIPGANYYQLVNEAIDKAGGYGIVTQYAGQLPTSFSDADLGVANGIKPANAYLTRFYTSYTPEHMALDPIFAPHAGLADVSSSIWLKDTTPPPNCTLTYLKSAACLVAFPVIPLALIIGAGVIWFRRRRATRA